MALDRIAPGHTPGAESIRPSVGLQPGASRPRVNWGIAPNWGGNWTLINKLREGPCEDCGAHFDPHLLHFHHERGPRSFCITSAGNKPIEEVCQELRKCDLLCAVCHSKRHGKTMTLDAAKNIGRSAFSSNEVLRVITECGGTCPTGFLASQIGIRRKTLLAHLRGMEWAGEIRRTARLNADHLWSLP